MRVYRVAQARHARSALDMLSGDGAAKYGGRWNSVGIPAIYCSESLSLCALEILVHLPRGVLNRYRYLELDVPDSKILALSPDANTDTQAAGDRYLGSGPSSVLAFSVPSAVNPLENNIIINPKHRDFEAVTYGQVAPFPMDERLTDR